MGAEGTSELSQLREENAQLRETLTNLQSMLKQSESDKKQLQTSYEEALQALADSEAKRETADTEMRLAHDQMSSMWKQLDSLHRKIDGSPGAPSDNSLVNETSLELHCTLCREKISPLSLPASPARSTPPVPSPDRTPPVARQRKASWFFGRRQSRMQDLEAHSKSCSSPSSSPSSSPARQHSKKITPSRSSSSIGSPLLSRTYSDYLMISVTRSPPGTTDLSPFKIITKTNLPQFTSSPLEVNRSQGDFQWLYEALQAACPERIIPPLRPPISLDATMSEFQRFLSRIAAHKTLRKSHLFVVFLSGQSEELKSVKAKHRPRHHDNQVQYKPAVGRDTNSGPLVATKEYLTTLEQNLLGLSNHLEQSVRRQAGSERTAHWFRAISESEPSETYLKIATSDLARTCETMESNHGDSEDALFIHNLQSIADYVRAAQGVLTRVEDAVDKFLYWDEEVTIMEAVTAETSPLPEKPVGMVESCHDDVSYDDSGISDVTSSSGQSAGHMAGHVTDQVTGLESPTDETSASEKWALASKYCAEAKDYLEMMCSGLSEELSHFDLQKEVELKHILKEYATRQLERHEKCQGKWYAMKFLLDSAIAPEKRAVEFSRPPPHTQTTGDKY